MPPRSKPLMSPALIRQLHIYVSAFVAPSLLFFAATGALQNFRLPDKPAAPMVVQKLARLHKDDVFAPKPARKAPPPGQRSAEPAKKAEAPATTGLKWFFTIASIGMIASTLAGIWMGLKASKRKRVVLALLAAGTLTPIVLIVMAGG